MKIGDVGLTDGGAHVAAPNHINFCTTEEITVHIPKSV